MAESIDLGGQANDRLSSSRLSFKSTGDVRFERDSDVLMVSANSAMGLEIISNGNITDADNARIHAQAWVRFEAVDVILGDSETNCVLIDSDLIQVEASGVREVSEGNCGQ